MKALILAAGYATRMYPLDQKLPKALLPIGLDTVMGNTVRLINEVPEINDIIIASHHRFIGDFRRWLEQYRGWIPVDLLDDGTTDIAGSLGAIGDICFCIDKKQLDEDVLIIAGDTDYHFSLGGFLSAWLSNGQDGVCVKRVEDPALLRHMGVTYDGITGVKEESAL